MGIRRKIIKAFKVWDPIRVELLYFLEAFALGMFLRKGKVHSEITEAVEDRPALVDFNAFEYMSVMA